MQNSQEFRRGFWAEGTPFIWLSGIAVLVLIGMMAGLIGLIFAKGTVHFWPADMVRLNLKQGGYVLGPVMETESVRVGGLEKKRTLIKTGNREATGLDFKWVDDDAVSSAEKPDEAAVLQRTEYGDMHGFIVSLKRGEEKIPASGPGFYGLAEERIVRARVLRREIKEASERLAKAREPLEVLEVEARRLQDGPSADAPETRMRLEELAAQHDSLEAKLGASVQGPERELEKLNAELDAWTFEVRVAEGETKDVAVKNILRLWRPNSMGVFAKLHHYGLNVWGFLADWPRESNTEGGVFPAVFGTVLMVLIMALAAAPIGVMAALYMHEYAKPGPFLSFVRMSVNNLAGVPSIVFGIFGLGFFVYFVGGGIDRLFYAQKLPEPTFGTGGILWASLTLALLTVPVVIVASLEGLAAVPRANREGALALGATRFQTIWNVVLPNAMPGILTGLILAVSRAAGEVAPLMITGVVKLAADLPVDAGWPFLHLDRKFMHLGFHIYDVGFQSPNVEAAKPMVYTTTGLLLLIVVVLNLLAISLRTRLRKKYKGAAL